MSGFTGNFANIPTQTGVVTQTGGGGSGFTAGGDLTGTSTNQTVVSLQNDEIAVSSAGALTWASGGTLVLSQSAQPTDTQPHSLTITAQSADPNAVTNTVGANVYIIAGSGSAGGSGKPGHIILSTPVSASGLSSYIGFDTLGLGEAGFPSIGNLRLPYQGAQAVGIGNIGQNQNIFNLTGNDLILGDESGTSLGYFQSIFGVALQDAYSDEIFINEGNFGLICAGTYQIYGSSAGLQFIPAGGQVTNFGGGVGVIGIGPATTQPTSFVPSGSVIWSHDAGSLTLQGGASTGNAAAGSITASLGTPANGGLINNEAMFVVQRAGVGSVFAVGAYPEFASTYCPMYFGNAAKAPAQTNYSFLGASDGTETFFNVPSATGQITFRAGSRTELMRIDAALASTQFNTAIVQVGGLTPAGGGGIGVLGITNATVAPSSNPAGGGILFASSSAGNPYWMPAVGALIPLSSSFTGQGGTTVTQTFTNGTSSYVISSSAPNFSQIIGTGGTSATLSGGEYTISSSQGVLSVVPQGGLAASIAGSVLTVSGSAGVLSAVSQGGSKATIAGTVLTVSSSAVTVAGSGGSIVSTGGGTTYTVSSSLVTLSGLGGVSVATGGGTTYVASSSLVTVAGSGGTSVTTGGGTTYTVSSSLVTLGLLGSSGMGLTTGGGTTYTLSGNICAQPSSSYVVMGLDTVYQPNERKLTAGAGVTITDGGAGGNVTIASSYAAPYLTASFTAASAGNAIQWQNASFTLTATSLDFWGIATNVTNITCSLPTASLCPGKIFYICDIAGSASINSFEIKQAPGDVIDGTSGSVGPLNINANWDTVKLISLGSSMWKSL